MGQIAFDELGLPCSEGGNGASVALLEFNSVSSLGREMCEMPLTRQSAPFTERSCLKKVPADEIRLGQAQQAVILSLNSSCFRV